LYRAHIAHVTAQALYPNFARTAPNQGQNMIALAHLAEFFGWRNVSDIIAPLISLLFMFASFDYVAGPRGF
jgi:hypothetical protein